MSNSPLYVVNENDEIIGKETSERIHREGLLHRVAHVWIYNGKGEVIFQRRSATKDTYPNRLDASVGGHVEIGETYLQAALKELEEETGLIAQSEELVDLGKRIFRSFDASTNTTPCHVFGSFALRYDDPIKKLRIEKEDGAGFVLIPIDQILNLPENDKGRFTPGVVDSTTQPIYRTLKVLASKK